MGDFSCVICCNNNSVVFISNKIVQKLQLFIDLIYWSETDVYCYTKFFKLQSFFTDSLFHISKKRIIIIG